MKNTLVIIGVIAILIVCAVMYWYIKIRKTTDIIKSNAIAQIDKDIENEKPKSIVGFLQQGINKTDMKPIIKIGKQVKGLGIKV